MARRPKGKVPVDSGKPRLDVDHMRTAACGDPQRACLTSREPAIWRRPFDRAAPVKRLHDAERFAVQFPSRQRLDDPPAGARPWKVSSR